MEGNGTIYDSQWYLIFVVILTLSVQIISSYSWCCIYMSFVYPFHPNFSPQIITVRKEETNLGKTLVFWSLFGWYNASCPESTKFRFINCSILDTGLLKQTPPPPGLPAAGGHTHPFLPPTDKNKGLIFDMFYQGLVSNLTLFDLASSLIILWTDLWLHQWHVCLKLSQSLV